MLFSTRKFFTKDIKIVLICQLLPVIRYGRSHQAQRFLTYHEWLMLGFVSLTTQPNQMVATLGPNSKDGHHRVQAAEEISKLSGCVPVVRESGN